MLLKSTNYYCIEINAKGELLLMSTLNKSYLKFASEYSKQVLDLLESDSIIEYCEGSKNYVISTLHNYGYLYDADFDESLFVDVEYKTHIFSDNWLYLTILPTNNCNFRCVYCYENPKEEKMSDQTESDILDFVRKNIRKYKNLRLNWFGGEPLLEKERVIRMSKEISNICKENGVPMIGLMSTNGYELDMDTFVELIRSRILSYQICLDGNMSSHNTQRPHFLNHDSYEQIFNNLCQIKKYVKSNTFKIGIRANMTPDVEVDLEKHLKNLFDSFGDDKRFSVYFQGVRDWGGDRFKENKPELIENEEDYYKKWYDIACNIGLNSAEHLEFSPVYGLCEANLKNGYVVTYDGKIIKCSLASYNDKFKEINEIGFIGEKGKLYLNQAKHAKWIVNRVKMKKCYTCNVFPICCGGSCPYMKNIKGKHSCLPIQEMMKAHLRCADNKGFIGYN